MASQHEQAVKNALRTSDMLADLFARLGTAQHPRGRILSAYRQARRAMKGVDDPAVVNEILAELRIAIQTIAQTTLWEAAAGGSQQAERQVALYGLPVVLAAYTPRSELDAWLAGYDAQRAAILSVAFGAGDMNLVLGDGTRVGLLSPAPVIRDGAKWLAAAAAAGVMTSVLASLNRADAQVEYGKQAVAAIDERTTDCCLRVNGQVQPMGEPFKLTGFPRYADELQQPGFHWYCRTGMALVRMAEADDALTRGMRAAAIAEMGARTATGERVEIHPASSRSRR